MLRRLFQFSSRSITSAALLLGGASFLSRLLGLLRARIFAHQFGAGAQLDMYYAAFRIPDLIFSIIIMGAVSSAFIPIFTSYRIKHRKKDPWLLANNFLHSFSLLVLVLAITLIIIAPYLVKIIAPGFSPSAQKTTVALTRIMMLQPVILAISGIVAGVLQSLNVFFAYALSPIMYNIGIIAGALFLVPKMGIQGLAWGVVLGSFLHLLIQLPSLFLTGYRYRFYINLKDALMKKIIKLTIPRSLGLAAIQLNLIVMTAIASGLATGSIAIFNYANDIQYVPLGLVGIAYAAAAFPTLSAAFAKRSLRKFRASLIKSVLEIFYLVIPVAIIFFILRHEITSVLLQTGKFTENAAWLTAASIGIFCIGIPFQSLIPLLSRAFFALHNTITPVIINFIAVGINVSLALLLIKAPFFEKYLHFASAPPGAKILALPLAFSLAGILNASLLFVFLEKKIRPIQLKPSLIVLAKILTANIMLLAVAGTFKTVLYGFFGNQTVKIQFLIGVLVGIASLALYFIFSYLLRLQEYKNILKVFKKA
jgi:putative peptidoglycan lipid II flippase